MTDNTGKALTVAIVGCGSISHHYFRTATEIDGVGIVGAVDVRRDAALGRAMEFGLDESVVYGDIDVMLNRVKPDVVFDCTVPAAHCEVTTRALAAGCHVLGEKPMADSIANAQMMVAAARKSGRTYAVMQNYRYSPHIRAFKGLVNDGTIGRLDMLNVDYFMAPHFGGWREHIPHPILIEMAIHTYDLARLISGADPVSVYCHEHDPKGSWYEGGNAAATSIFEMSDGITLSYRGHWCAESVAGSTGTGWWGHWRAVGDSGTAICLDENRPWADVALKPGPGLWSEHERVEAGPVDDRLIGGHEGLIRDFLDCVRTGRRPETDCTDNIKTLAMVFASIASAESGSRVDITW